MSKLKRHALSTMTAAAVPIGIAAVFAFQAPASATSAVAAHSSAAMVRLAAARPGAELLRRHHRHHKVEPARLRAYAWAVTQTGAPYEWGGTGPGYDCSGLVMMAYRHAGIHLPRTTSEMLGSPLLVRVKIPRMGDLAFYGSGHVELFRKWGWTFGAHDYGSTVGLIHYGWGWKPTAYYRVRTPHHRHHHHHRHHRRRRDPS